jgi:hypothetical protein
MRVKRAMAEAMQGARTEGEDGSREVGIGCQRRKAGDEARRGSETAEDTGVEAKGEEAETAGSEDVEAQGVASESHRWSGGGGI